ncbi:MAG: hypothetical protein EA396_10670 [Anaerolineaceae bacterium]|nr:MAG: hypothetical protein EA396_10670 [Anaerolineaceae bacterium]
MASKSTVKKQIRGFAFVWTALTFMIGLMVFFAIYLTYDVESSPVLAASSSDVMLPERQQPEEPEAVAPVSAQATPEAASQPEEIQATAVATISLSDFAAQQAATPTPVPPVDTSDQFLVGVQVQEALDGDREGIQRVWMNDVGDMGLNWFKHQVRWYQIEPEPGVYNWTTLDLVLPIAQEYGYNVLASVVAAPDWARDPNIDLSAEGPPLDYQLFADFLQVMLERYPGMIQAVEIWNEPNIDREWMAPEGVRAADFVNLVRLSAQAIKNVDPGIIVISGAPSPTGGFVDPADGVMRAINDFDYIDQMIEAGVLDYIDCLGAHHNGYNVPPRYRWNEIPPRPDAQFRGPFDNPHHSWSFRSTLETYYNKVAVAGRPDIKLCVTEFGWASVDELDGYPPNFGFAADNSLEDQRDYTIEALDLMEEWGFVWIAIIWNLNYAPQAGWSTESDNVPYSLIGPEFSKRPAFAAVREWMDARADS